MMSPSNRSIVVQESKRDKQQRREYSSLRNQCNQPNFVHLQGEKARFPLRRPGPSLRSIPHVTSFVPFWFFPISPSCAGIKKKSTTSSQQLGGYLHPSINETTKIVSKSQAAPPQERISGGGGRHGNNAALKRLLFVSSKSQKCVPEYESRVIKVGRVF